MPLRDPLYLSPARADQGTALRTVTQPWWDGTKGLGLGEADLDGDGRSFSREVEG